MIDYDKIKNGDVAYRHDDGVVVECVMLCKFDGFVSVTGEFDGFVSVTGEFGGIWIRPNRLWRSREEAEAALIEKL